MKRMKSLLAFATEYNVILNGTALASRTIKGLIGRHAAYEKLGG